MSAQPIDLNDDDLDGVTGGAGADAGKVALAQASGGGKSALLDLAKADPVHAGALGSAAMAALEASAGKLEAAKTRQSASADAAHDLLKAAGDMSAAAGKQDLAAAAFKEMLAKNANDPQAIQKALGEMMKSGASVGDVQTLLQNAMAAMKTTATDVGKAKPTGSGGGKIDPGAAGAHLGAGMGNVAAGAGESPAASKQAEADAKQDAAQAQMAATQDMAAQRDQAINEMMKQIMTFVHDLQDSKADAMRAITRA